MKQLMETFLHFLQRGSISAHRVPQICKIKKIRGGTKVAHHTAVQSRSPVDLPPSTAPPLVKDDAAHLFFLHVSVNYLPTMQSVNPGVFSSFYYLCCSVLWHG
jgi:hypothetical protein